jgi:hypothetical protein
MVSKFKVASVFGDPKWHSNPATNVIEVVDDPSSVGVIDRLAELMDLLLADFQQSLRDDDAALDAVDNFHEQPRSRITQKEENRLMDQLVQGLCVAYPQLID